MATTAKKTADRHEQTPGHGAAQDGVGAPENPKKHPDGSGASNQIKDPSDWVTGEEPMTGAQASYLKTLSEQVHNPEAFDPGLDKADASKRINELKQESGR